MPEHWLNLQGVATIKTGAYLTAQELLNEAAECGGIVTLLGDSGHGKSFALDSWLEQAPLPTFRLEPFANTTRRQLVADLLKAVSEEPESPGGTEYTLTLRLIEELAERPRLGAIDEAQWLTNQTLKAIRGIWMRPEVHLALVFAGGPEFEVRLDEEPMLKTRRVGTVQFQPLREAEVLEHLPQYHPIYRDAAANTLRRVDRDYGNGCLRLWANFTRAALKRCQQNDQETLTQEVAADVLRLVT
jgi:type II secretory pathway predicted ATPase ExeA